MIPHRIQLLVQPEPLIHVPEFCFFDHFSGLTVDVDRAGGNLHRVNDVHPCCLREIRQLAAKGVQLPGLYFEYSLVGNSVGKVLPNTNLLRIRKRNIIVFQDCVNELFILSTH